jgi:hypothetical protein
MPGARKSCCLRLRKAVGGRNIWVRRGKWHERRAAGRIRSRLHLRRVKHPKSLGLSTFLKCGCPVLRLYSGEGWNAQQPGRLCLRIEFFRGVLKPWPYQGAHLLRGSRTLLM